MIRLTDEQSTAIRSAAASRPAAGGWRRMSFAILFICACFCAICSWIIFDARQAAWKSAGVVRSTGISARYSRLSIGVASLVPNAAGHMRDLVTAADEALYRAKELGRNRTELQEQTAAVERKRMASSE